MGPGVRRDDAATWGFRISGHAMDARDVIIIGMSAERTLIVTPDPP